MSQNNNSGPIGFIIVPIGAIVAALMAFGGCDSGEYHSTTTINGDTYNTDCVTTSTTVTCNTSTYGGTP